MINKILFCWIQNRHPIEPENLACIERAHELYPEAKIHIVSNIPFPYQWVEVESYEYWLDKILHRCSNAEKHFVDPVIFSDYLRFIYLSENKNTLWLDTDCYLIDRLPEPPPGKCLAKHIYLIYSNDCCDELNTMFDNRKMEGSMVILEKQLHAISIIPGDVCIHKEKNVRAYLEKKPFFWP